MNRFVGGLVLMALSVGFSSCSFHHLVAGKKARSYDSTKVVTSSSYAVFPALDTIAVAGKPIDDTTEIINKLIAEITPVWKSRLSYTTFKGKAKVHVQGPDDKQEFTAHIRLRKDSVIWVNITALGGVSFARVLVTRDSFFMTQPMNHMATRMPLSHAAKVLPTKVDFSSLQNMLVGEPLRDGNVTYATSFGGSWSVQVEDSSYIQRITYNKADSTLRSGQMRTRDPKGPQAITEYGSYETVDGKRVSTARVINIRNGDDIYSIDMNFNNISFDEVMDYPFSIPESYEIKDK